MLCHACSAFSRRDRASSELAHPHAPAESGFSSEGIFRRSVALGRVRELKARYNAGERVNLTEVGDPQMAAVLLKSFFRELAEPLLTFKLYDNFLPLADASEPEEKLAKYREVLAMLPERNLAVLRCLVAFLLEVTKHEATNKCVTSRAGVCRCGHALHGLLCGC